MNSIAKKLAEGDKKILLIEQKVQQLERLATNFTSTLDTEINSRKLLEEKTTQNNAGNDCEIEKIKLSIENMNKNFTNKINNVDKEIRETISTKSENIILEINEKLKLLNYFDKKFIEKSFQQNSFETEIKSKFKEMDSEIKTIFKELKEEMNVTSSRLDIIEKKLNDNLEIFRENENQINIEMTQFKAEISSLGLFKDNSNKNFKNIHEDMLNQEQIITSFSSKINFTLKEYENKLKSFEYILGQEMEKLKQNRDEFQRRVDLIDSKFNSKLSEIDSKIFKQTDLNIKEIDNFENHVLSEMEKFQSFIQSKHDEQNSSFKKIVELTNDDLTILKNKHEKIEEDLSKIKNDFFNQLNEAEEFLTKKYEGLFRMITAQPEQIF